MPTCAHRRYHDHIVQRLLTSDLELLIFEEAGSVPLVDRQSVRFIDGLVPALALQRRESHVCAFCGPGVRTELLYVHVWFFFDILPDILPCSTLIWQHYGCVQLLLLLLRLLRFRPFTRCDHHW